MQLDSSQRRVTMSIEGKVVAITGASSGIGRAAAKLLAAHGAFVVLGARNEDWDAMTDVNLRGTRYGIAAARPIFAHQASGHVVNVISTASLAAAHTPVAGRILIPAVRALTEALRREAGSNLSVTEVLPGMVATNFGDSIVDHASEETIGQGLRAIAIAPDATARGILFALEQPPEVDIDSIVMRPTAHD
jgi:NADP-dependent 3-hydroxy acid dehydrogenase YdfG